MPASAAFWESLPMGSSFGVPFLVVDRAETSSVSCTPDSCYSIGPHGLEFNGAPSRGSCAEAGREAVGILRLPPPTGFRRTSKCNSAATSAPTPLNSIMRPPLCALARPRTLPMNRRFADTQSSSAALARCRRQACGIARRPPRSPRCQHIATAEGPRGFQALSARRLAQGRAVGDG